MRKFTNFKINKILAIYFILNMININLLKYLLLVT